MHTLRPLLPFLFLALSLPAFAQNLELKISNPQPRVGEAFTVSFSMNFFNEQMSTQLQQQHAALEISQPSYADKEYSRTLTATRAGQYQIGPFRFTFNGTTYTSNRVTIDVIDSLPRQEGFWLRHVRLQGEEFLILEQKRKSTQTGSYRITSAEGIDPAAFDAAFASLLLQPAAGISMSRRHTSLTSNESPENVDELPLTYALQIYRIEKGEGFAGSLQLKPEHFQNLPANAQLPELVLR